MITKEMREFELSDPEDIKIDGLPSDVNIYHIEPSSWDAVKFVVSAECCTGLVPTSSDGQRAMVLKEKQKYPHCTNLSNSSHLQHSLCRKHRVRIPI